MKPLEKINKLLPCIVLLVFGSAPGPAPCSSGPESVLRPMEEINTELTEKKKQFTAFDIQEKDLLGQLARFEKDIELKNQIIQGLRAKIRDNKNELQKQESRLRKLEESLAGVEKRLGQRLTAFYKYARRGYLKLLMSSADMDELRKGMQYLNIIVREDLKLFRDKQDLKQVHEREIALVSRKLADIRSMEQREAEQLESQKAEVEKKVILLMKIHQEKRFYETAVQELQAAAMDLKRTLVKLDREQEKNKTPLPSGFTHLKGELPPPCHGKIIPGDERLQASKGIYIVAPLDSEVKAVFPGKVDYSGWLKGYGQLVIINHGNRCYTISAHLSRRIKQEGETVGQGEVIGLLGQTGSLSGPGLYFEMRRAGDNLEPLEWLKLH